MISVNDLWLMVNDLSRKDHAGYSSTDEFNRNLLLAQEDLYEYYILNYERDANAGEALSPFIVPAYLPYNETGRPLPSDYRQRLAAALEIYRNVGAKDQKADLVPAVYVAQNELYLVLQNEIEKPSMSNEYSFRYEVYGGLLKAYPDDFKGRVFLKYFKNAPTATRAFTLNLVTQEEELDPLNTIDLEWPQSETSNFVDLLMLYKGVAIRDSDIINWVAGKRNLTPIKKSQ